MNWLSNVRIWYPILEITRILLNYYWLGCWSTICHTLQSFLLKHGIVHQKSCPYTPQQNGLAERKNRHIIEIALTLLHHSHLPPKFWYHACATAVFLINKMPCSTLSMSSPFELLHKKLPPLDSIRVVGCACFPLLLPIYYFMLMISFLLVIVQGIYILSKMSFKKSLTWRIWVCFTIFWDSISLIYQMDCLFLRVNMHRMSLIKLEWLIAILVLLLVPHTQNNLSLQVHRSQISKPTEVSLVVCNIWLSRDRILLIVLTLSVSLCNLQQNNTFLILNVSFGISKGLLTMASHSDQVQ